ncbi:MAG: AMP-binding protein [Deltaproteobacteria bacterium]|nr:AMP-binding protein [Deltaproteobacteria bacterium]
MNLSQMVDRAASDMPDHTALVFQDMKISYSELLKGINRLSNALVQAGVKRGDRVVTLMGNRPEFVMSYFAVIRLGAICVTLNPMSTSYELSHYVGDCKPVAIISGPDQSLKIKKAREHADYLKTVISVEPQDGEIVFAEIQRDFPDDFPAVDLDENSPAVIIFTAGLLGRALGATLSHGNLDSNSDLLTDVCGRGPEARSLALIPLFHAFGTSVNLLSTIKAGGTVYLVEKVDFPRLIPWLKEALINFVGFVPMVFYGLIYHPSCKDLNLSSLDIAISGGAPLSMEIYERFCEKYKIDIYHGYGLTEASPVVSWNNINVPNKPRTVGLPIPKMTIGIHDDAGQPLPVGVEGEVVVQGASVMLGYYGKPNETKTVIRNGWLYTGDIGFLDDDGYLTLTGLKKDLIITSGFNVYCQEVEEVLIRHPSVADVALVGVPDLMRGQVIEAVIVPESGVKPDDREIIRFCKEYLSRYKCPRKVTFVKEITRDPNGKASGWK